MNHRDLIAPIVGLTLALTVSLTVVNAGDLLDPLLSRLVSGDRSAALFLSIEEQPPNARTLPALRAAFENSQTQQDKQRVAATLIRLGETSPEYFNYLSVLAREGIAETAPYFAKYDHGSPVRGELDPGFLNWCAINNKTPKEVAALEAGAYPNNLRMLAYAQDQRALEIFKDGLQSSNPLVVALSVEGLARLNAVSALPLVEKALGRAQPGDRIAIALYLPWFGTTEAEGLLTRFVPDARTRELHRRPIDLIKAAEYQRALKRQAKPPKQ